MKDGRSLSDYEVWHFISDAVLLDLSHKKPGDSIDDEDLEAAEEGAGLVIREGQIAVIQTRWGTLNRKGEHASGFPVLSDNAAQYLEFKRVAGVGMDTPNVDKSPRDLRVHSILFRAGVFIVENLCRLEAIEEPRFRMIALPLKVKSAVSPVRAVGVFEGIG